MNLAQQSVQLILLEKSVPIHRMPVGSNFASIHPVPQCVRGDPEVVGSLRYQKEIT